MTKIVCSGEQTFPSGGTVARSIPANTSLQRRFEPREGARRGHAPGILRMPQHLATCNATLRGTVSFSDQDSMSGRLAP